MRSWYLQPSILLWGCVLQNVVNAVSACVDGIRGCTVSRTYRTEGGVDGRVGLGLGVGYVPTCTGGTSN